MRVLRGLCVACAFAGLLFIAALEGFAQSSQLMEQTAGPLRIPGAVAADTCSIEGDPGIFFGFPDEPQSILTGYGYDFQLAPANFGFDTSPCQGPDTFCLHVFDTEGWPIIVDGPVGTGNGDCFELVEAYYNIFDVNVTIPCSALPGDIDTVFAVMAYCDINGLCSSDCGDCMDPNWYSGNPIYSADTLILHVLESPPAIFILQDTLYYVEDLQTQAYVPFAICNGSPCSPPADYVYGITNTGNQGEIINQSDTLFAVVGGECADVFAVVYGPGYDVGAFDTLTIIAWDLETGTAYDTCVQVINIIENCCVPLFDKIVVIVMVLMVIASAAVMIRIRMLN